MVYDVDDAPAETPPAQWCFAEHLRAPVLLDGLCRGQWRGKLAEPNR
ncbi:MAG TPA: hypothetical protein VF328_19280 [Mycobacterium sp.]